MTKILFLPTAKELALIVLFGALSIGLGLSLQISVPGLAIDVSFFEIPLLISLIHFRSPLSVFLISLFGACIVLAFPSLSFTSTFFSHFISLLIIWYLFHRFSIFFESNLASWMFWSLLVISYYFLLLIPLIVLHRSITNQAALPPIDIYISMIASAKYEMIPAILVSSFYLLQYEIRVKLMDHKNNLEETVSKRTAEISEAMAELTRANKEIQMLNGNLENLVAKRTIKINQQLDQLKRYTHLNSHEVRAPIARILGLINLLKLGASDLNNDDLVEKIHFSALELDEIIKKMNQLLTDESIGEAD